MRHEAPMRLNTQRLRTAAAEHGDTSDYQIAGRTGLSKSTLSRLTNGKCLPQAATLMRFRRAYGLSADDLLVADDLPAAA
ncbi:helix-turn-helix domain-containing protein [Kitasatospora camelliae]|uniref:Helix-turn-helix transcriptional regulator n=1 Tax=Kitasatospora camelliae TaxID=3156397 RepID=A0AAU8K419_9ACTN